MHLIDIAALIAFPFWVLLLVVLWRNRRWLPFYILGGLGLVVFVVVLMAWLGWDRAIEGFEAQQVRFLASHVGLTLVVLGRNGLAIKNHTGWGVFDVGIECSALLEMTAMAGLIAFYPSVFSPLRKVAILAIGTGMTYIFNLLRILFIVAIVANLGTDWVFAAHAVFGRMLFFVLTIGLYWWLVTRPTVRHIGKQLAAEHE